MTTTITDAAAASKVKLVSPPRLSSSPRIRRAATRIVPVACLLLFRPGAVCWAQLQQCEVPQQPTPRDALGPFYVENSTLTSRVGPESMLSDPTQRLQVNGRVLSSIDCNVGLANITVELWYAGEPDEFGNFYQENEYRGQVMTDECGRYSFTQTFPALYPARPILHNHFRLSNPNGQELLVTQMYFQGQGEGYYSSGSRELQAVAIEEDESGARSVVFDIFVNVAGDSSTSCTDGGLPTTETQLPTAVSPSGAPLTEPSETPTGAFSASPTFSTSPSVVPLSAAPISAPSETPTGKFSVSPAVIPTSTESPSVVPSSRPTAATTEKITGLEEQDASSSSTNANISICVSLMGVMAASFFLLYY